MVSRAIIEQQRREFGYGVPATAPNAGPLLALDLSTGLTQQYVLNANCFIAEPVNAPAVGDILTLMLTQDGTGSRSVTWGVCFRDAPAWSPGAAGTRASARFLYDGFSYQYLGGSSAFAVSGLALVPGSGSATLASDPALPKTNPAPTVVALTLAGVAPTLTANTIVTRTPTIGTLTAAGVAPVVSAVITPAAAAVTLQGQSAGRTP